MAHVCGSVSKEDGIVAIDKGGIIVQSDLPVHVVLTDASLSAGSPVCEGVSMGVVFPDTRFEDMECMRMWVGVHQRSQWCTGLTCDGCIKCSGELSDEGGLNDVRLIVKGEV